MSEIDENILRNFLTCDEIGCAQIVEEMKTFIADNYGFDISKKMGNVNVSEIPENEYKDHLINFILGYADVINKIISLYQKFHQADNLNCNNFFSEFLRLFSEDENRLDFGEKICMKQSMITKMTQSLKSKVKKLCIKSFRGKKIPFTDFVKFLKEQNLINISTFDGNDKDLRVAYDT